MENEQDYLDDGWHTPHKGVKTCSDTIITCISDFVFIIFLIVWAPICIFIYLPIKYIVDKLRTK